MEGLLSAQWSNTLKPMDLDKFEKFNHLKLIWSFQPIRNHPSNWRHRARHARLTARSPTVKPPGNVRCGKGGTWYRQCYHEGSLADLKKKSRDVYRGWWRLAKLVKGRAHMATIWRHCEDNSRKNEYSCHILSFLYCHSVSFCHSSPNFSLQVFDGFRLLGFCIALCGLLQGLRETRNDKEPW
jgi:hypothetical protein